jgi:hypothetical protein
MEQQRSVATIPDRELLDRLARHVRDSRCTEADLITDMAEVDARKLYAEQACPSMFSYATRVLHFSEPEAYLRIVAARASRKHPVLLAMLADGQLHLSGIALLASHLTPQNRDAVLARARHRSKREIQQLVAELSPRPDVPARMRKLPEKRHDEGALPESSSAQLLVRAEETRCPGPAAQLRPDEVVLVAPAPAPRPSIEPLAPARYKVQFTASAGLHEKLERLRALMRSQVPDGDLGVIIEQAISEKLERLDARRFATTKRPRKELAESDVSASSRRVPAAVKRLVAKRDGMSCQYVDEQGQRCPEHHQLEFHHVYPYGFGGDHRPEDIRLMCRTHNQLIADHDYGRTAMERHRRSRDRGPEDSAPSTVTRPRRAPDEATRGPIRLPSRTARRVAPR